MKYIPIFVMFCIMLTLMGCGKDVERKIEVTIKDSVNKNKEQAPGNTVYECSADDMKNINISAKNDSLKNIMDIIKKIHNIDVSYPDKLKSRRITLELKNISIENLFDSIATQMNVTVDHVDGQYVFK